LSKRKRRPHARFSVKATRCNLTKLLELDLNVHHMHYPRRAYEADPIAKQFRELPCQRVITEVSDHTALHRSQPQPNMPTHRQMVAVINNCSNSGCDRQGCTKPIKLACDPTRIDLATLPATVVAIRPFT
jgi:hypothetical protein